MILRNTWEKDFPASPMESLIPLPQLCISGWGLTSRGGTEMVLPVEQDSSPFHGHMPGTVQQEASIISLTQPYFFSFVNHLIIAIFF